MASFVPFPGPKRICRHGPTTVNVERLAKRLGRLSPNSLAAVSSILEEMFAP
jgi:hypothetical protein